MRKVIFPVLAVLGLGIVGCDTSSPHSPAQQTAMKSEARAALEKMEANSPNLRSIVDSAYGYAVLPDVGKAALVVGGSHGKGEVFRNGQMIGYVTLEQVSVGVQAGGESYAELIVFQDEAALQRLMDNKLDFGADASAEIIKAGAAAAGQFRHGVKIYVLPKGGLMAGADLNGQKLIYHAAPSQTAAE